MKIIIVLVIVKWAQGYLIKSHSNQENRRFKLKNIFNRNKGDIWSENRELYREREGSESDVNGSQQKLFKLMELPYNMDELSPEISRETVEYHYLKHHAGYVNKLNELGKSHPYIYNYSLEELIKMEGRGTNVYNMACQVWNHDFYWLGLDPRSQGRPSTYLENLINESFGSFEDFKQKFTEASMKHFGSGWVWLLYFKFEPHLRVVDTHDCDNPIKLFNLNPLLVIGEFKGDFSLIPTTNEASDVWEHAYYIDYRNDRKSYIQGWFNKVNWNRVENLIKTQV